MANAEILTAGDDYFGLGADQFTTAQKIAIGKYVSSENTICRGGVVQTRPGSKCIMTLPDGVPQGATLFQPASGFAHIVAAVSGKVYVSPYPFTSYRQLENIQFGPTSPFVSWSVCLKSTDYTPAGELYFLDNPYSVLMMQDGVTRAAYWDGSTSGHIDPTPSPTTITQPGYDGTPLGLWMRWANNRLWVSRDNQVRASDIGNPLKFTEAQYLNEGRAFYLPENCTGIAATTDQQGIICFTERTGTFLQSSIQDRTAWLDTTSFQIDIFPTIGCVSPRSICSQYGMLWWYSSRGLINQDDALRANITSRVNVQDNPMFSTKANMSFNLSGACGTPYENMLLMSVPYGDKYNTRTMVLDQSPLGDQSAPVNAWASYWTGWRPVEWASGVVGGEERIFFLSNDYDDKNRIWEIGTQNKTDNGVAITCNLITREHLFGNRDNKILNYVESELCNIRDDVSFMTSVAGIRGGWQIVGRKEIVSTQGQIYQDSVYGEGANKLAGTSEQVRVVKSENYVSPNSCNSVCVESDTSSGLIDKGFSVMFTWSGIMGVMAYRIFARPDSNHYNGACESNEEAPRLTNDEGCGALEYFSDGSPFTLYSSTKTFSQKVQETSLPISYTATQTSIISQADADRKAEAAARSYVSAQLGQ
jgi:hypothetical protein